mgnify:FL=1
MSLLQRALANIRSPAIRAVAPARLPASAPFGHSAGLLGGSHRANLNRMGQTSWLFSVVDAIASSVAAVEWHLYQRGRKRELTEIDDHEAMRLWLDISPFATQFEFVEAMVQNYCLVGEMWAVKLPLQGDGGGKPRELMVIRPDMITPVPSREQYIAGYIYQVGGERIPLAREDVMSAKRSNPSDPYRGIGPVQALLYDLDSERFSAIWNRSFFINGAEPGGVIEFPDELSDIEWERFGQRWREGHQGVGNAHRVAVL